MDWDSFFWGWIFSWGYFRLFEVDKWISKKIFKRKEDKLMICEKCGILMIFVNTDDRNGLKGYWRCHCTGGLQDNETKSNSKI